MALAKFAVGMQLFQFSLLPFSFRWLKSHCVRLSTKLGVRRRLLAQSFVPPAFFCFSCDIPVADCVNFLNEIQ